MSKTKIVIEVSGGSVVSIGETGYTEEVDRIVVVVINHDNPDDNPNKDSLVQCYVPDWQAPTASEMFQENANIYKQLKQIEDKYN